MFKKMHHLEIVAILDTFTDSVNVINFKNQVAMVNSITNYNGKIWLFRNADVDCIVREQDEQ